MTQLKEDSRVPYLWVYSIAIFFVFFNLLHSKVLLTPFSGDLSNDQINSGSISLLFPTIPGQICNCDITITFLTVYPPCMHVHCVHSYSSFCFFVLVKSKLKSNYKMSLFITLSFESDILFGLTKTTKIIFCPNWNCYLPVHLQKVNC